MVRRKRSETGIEYKKRIPRIVPIKPKVKLVRVNAPAKPSISDSMLPIKFLARFQKEDLHSIL